MPSDLQKSIRDRGLIHSPDTVCALDGSNRILFCNPAWDTFALANHGRDAISANVIGTDILDACCDSLREFYATLFTQCRVSQSTCFHGYHCSTPERLRVFEMTLHPSGDFILIVHHLLSEGLHPDRDLPFEPRYVQEGILTMCANCRRTRNWQTGSWDWVPESLTAQDRYRFSHGLCLTCAEFYYGEDFTHSSQDLQSN